MTTRRLQVRVKPRSRTSAFLRAADGTWSAQLKSAPVDGKANAELVALVAKYFDVPRTAVTIKSGASGRQKWLTVEK
jgi:uncharacterized protein YggU (UPF0235/DUF167 family)